MGVSGDFARLRRIARAVNQLGSGAALRSLNRNLAEEAIELIAQGFEKQSSPDGNRWAPITHRTGEILKKSGRLKSSYKSGRVTARGFTISSSVSYGTFHQTGTRHMPSRQMVPDGKLPSSWERAFVTAATKFLERQLNV